MTTTPIEQLASLRVGTVEFISPDRIEVQLDIESPDSVALNTGTPRSFPRINGYVMIPVDLGFVVGQVSWITIQRSPYPKRSGFQDFGLIDLPFPLRKMELQPVGTLVATEKGYKFKRGLETFPSVGDIQYRILTKNYIDDFLTLLREHSPVKYDNDYFSKQFMRINSHFSFGAFIEINGIEYLIGYILANLVKEKTFFQNVKKIYRTKTCFRSCLNYFKSTPEIYGVITNLGVIDEYRRMGVGKKLLEYMEEQLKMKGAIGIMTHLIEHNCSGIKFFEGCNWKYGGFIKQFYNFNGNLYDGQVYYKILFYEDEFDEVEYRGLNEPQIDRQFQIVRLCRFLKNIIKS